MQKRVGKGLRELATKEKLGRKSYGALAVTKINELRNITEEQLSIIHMI